MRPVPGPATGVVPVVTGLLLLAACGLLTSCGMDVSQSDDREPQADAVRDGLAALWAGTSPEPEALEEGRCFAAALTERVPLDDLVEAGVVADDGTVAETVPMLTLDVADAWVDALADCTTYAVTAARGAGLSDPDAVDALVTCLDAAVPVDQQRRGLIATLTGRFGTNPDARRLATAQDGCVDEVG